MLSAYSNNSGQVMRELEAAVTRGLPVVPLRIEDVELSKSLRYFIKSIHWLDALTPPIEQHLRRLAETVRLFLSRSGTEESTPARPAAPAQRPPREKPVAILGENKPGAIAQQHAKQKWLIVAAMAVSMLLMGLVGLWVSGVIYTKTKDGVIVLEDLPPDAELLVDGRAVTVQSADGKTPEVHVVPDE